MSEKLPIQIGDILENVSPYALCKRVRVTEVSPTHFKADVLEGENTRDPLTVFRAGWHLYRKSNVHYNN